MIIKDSKPNPPPDRSAKGRLKQAVRNTIKIIVWLIFGGVLISSLFAFQPTEISRALQEIFTDKIVPVRNPLNAFNTSPLEHIDIRIKDENFQKIKAKRKEVMERGDILYTTPEDYVPATIYYKNKPFKAEVRLKGDWTDHLEGTMWSYRIKLLGDNALFGMRRFSIQHPERRAYLHEQVFQQALKQEGILTPRYDFIKVSFNGEFYGVYALEEHFDSKLIEHNRYREGPIFKLDEDIRWKDRFYNRFNSSEGLQSEYASSIRTFQDKQVEKSPELYRQFIQGKDLLESFRRGDLSAHNVFDVEKMGNFLAISELMGALHGGAGRWNNLRVYYNPITSRLEPIEFDAHAGELVRVNWNILRINLMREEPGGFMSKILYDKEIRKAYVRKLEEITHPSYLDGFFKKIDSDLRQTIKKLCDGSKTCQNNPEINFSKDNYYENQKFLRRIINPVKALHAYYYKAGGSQLTLEIRNLLLTPVEIRGVRYGYQSLFAATENAVLPAEQLKNYAKDYTKVTFSLPEDFVWTDNMADEIKVAYSLLGSDRIREDAVFPYPSLTPRFEETDVMRQPANITDFNFIIADSANKRVLIPPGSWTIEKNLIIPKDRVLIVAPGTKINLINSAKIISYSPVELIGSEEDPIYVKSVDGSGQGLIVLDAGRMSLLGYVTFDNLSSPDQNNWGVSGAVTFYQSPVAIKKCRFLNARSEDSLNIVRSPFSIGDSLFSKNQRDALDVDFSQGQILNSKFLDSGNDAIDISGSVVELDQISIERAGDKGLSVGESSYMTAKNIKIEIAVVGMASKDSSRLEVENASVSSCAIGLAAYRKKPEFGSAMIIARNMTVARVKLPLLIQINSWISIDDKGKKMDPRIAQQVLNQYLNR